jgi:DNA-directed RNA polymerase specialized sigma24 family protein
VTDSRSLLAEYAANSSESAFHELVARYTDLVYSAAVRLLYGDVHLAEDVAQTVFVHLARKARTLSSETMLGGWLHHHTCLFATKAVRSQRRRGLGEREFAWMDALHDHTEANLAQLRPGSG